MSRESFEKWAADQTFLIKAGDDYINVRQMAWEAWQAALESHAAQPKVPEGLEKDAARYRWLKANTSDKLTTESLRNEFAEHKCEFAFPKLISWADFCGPITLDEAIDFKIEAMLTASQEQER